MNKGKMLAAKFAKTTAEHALKRDANSTTCVAIYQPKAPADLNKFKSSKK